MWKKRWQKISQSGSVLTPICLLYNKEQKGFIMSGDTKRVLEVNQIDNLQGSTQRVKQETTLNNLRGFTQRVYVVGGGSTPVIDELNVTPSTSAQTITAPSGVDGYSPVNVAAVTSAIDANIVAGNIKKDVQILGVTGSYKGQTPTGTKSITANGVYDVTDFASADVQVPTTAPAHYVEKTVDANGKLKNSTNIINLNGVTDVDEGVLSYAYANVKFPANTSIDLSGLTTISGNNACQGMFTFCTGVTSVDLSGLTTISGGYACQNMFNNCGGLTSIDLSGLTTISGNNACNTMFFRCTALTSVVLSSLTTISAPNTCNNMFSNCAGLITVKFTALNTMTNPLSAGYAQVFSACTHLESVEFGGLTASTFSSAVNQIGSIFNNTTGSEAPNGCTVHFPSNFDPSDPSHTFDASTLTGYPTFGGSASYIHVAFDLPATE